VQARPERLYPGRRSRGGAETQESEVHNSGLLLSPRLGCERRGEEASSQGTDECTSVHKEPPA
jgi:hypothetical protein